MSGYKTVLASRVYHFADLRILLAKATPLRSGDQLAGIAADTAEERVAAQMALADVPLKKFLDEPLIPYETDEITRLIFDNHDSDAFSPIAHLTVGEFRDWLLDNSMNGEILTRLAPGLMPEQVAAVSKLMRQQDLIKVARKIRVISRFRTTVGLPGRLSTRLQPNHPADDPRAIAAAIVDGLLLGSGDAVIGINPASDDPRVVHQLLILIDRLRQRLSIPIQSCVLAHVTTQMQAIEAGAPVDLVFQSIGGTEATNTSFGVNLALLREAQQAAQELKRGTVGNQVMYFETGQGSALSANAHHGVDQQTCEARAYGAARSFHPMLVNTVVGFIGPEYLYNGKQILRASLEDHFCGKMLGLPMGCDICYTNHAEADEDDVDAMLTMLGAAGVNYIMGVPGADDIMLSYQSTSFHDALYLRRVFQLRPAPEFEEWLEGHRPALPELMRMIPLMIKLSDFTSARVGLGLTGDSLPLAALLDFRLAQARARDAVHLPLDSLALAQEMTDLRWQPRLIHSCARNRQEYLQRPDQGRFLDDDSAAEVRSATPCPLTFVVADGLSASAVHHHAIPLLKLVLRAPEIAPNAHNPVWIAHQGRVALGDHIGQLLAADLAVVLIGERPGLTTPDSLGVYLTWRPRPGCHDSARNCISNIHDQGLSYEEAAHKLLFLIRESRQRKLSGVSLKEVAGKPPGQLTHS